jgi:hypothetical protein
MNDIFNGKGVEVRIGEDDNFLKIKETLTRIGVASKKDKTLYQSCHILHKQGRYAIVHFKELFELDGKASDFSDEDKARRNLISKLLADWGLVNIVDPEQLKPLGQMNQLKVLPFNQKNEWNLVHKYAVGKKK